MITPQPGGVRHRSVAARIHQHALPMSQASLECTIATFPFLLNVLRRLGFRDRRNIHRGVGRDDGRFFMVFRRRGEIGDKGFQNCLSYRIGEICSVENRTQARLDSLGFLLSLLGRHLPAEQFFPKRQNGLSGCLSVYLQCRLYLSFEGLVVRVENSCEVPIGAVGRGILKNARAALEPRRNRKSGSASRAISQRMSNRHFDAPCARLVHNPSNNAVER
jgi:hypothetical protein